MGWLFLTTRVIHASPLVYRKVSPRFPHFQDGRQPGHLYTTWKCGICSVFIALTLKSLLSHYYSAHRNQANFFVKCGVNDCPATFRRYHSFYKHVSRKHGDEYHNNIDHVDINDHESPAHTQIQCFNASPTPSDDNMDNFDDLDFGDDSTISDSHSDSETPVTETSELDFKKTEAFYILKVKERNNITQVAMNNIVDSTSDFVKSAMEMAEKKLMDAWGSYKQGEDFSNTIKETFSNFPSTFESMKTSYLQTSFIKKNLNYVEFQEVVLGKKLSWKTRKNKRSLVEKDETFVYIPILESLAQLLSNKRVAKLLMKNPSCCDPGIYYDICDGHVFKSDKLFTDKPDALQIIMYHDAVEVYNPLGSHAGTHKLDMFYYTLGNLNPKVRSKHCAIRLLGIVNAKLVKKYGYDAILKPMLADIHKLENGYSITVGDEEKVVYGKVVCCTGDNEGQHEWAGFKLGVGFAFQKCRHCHCTFENMQQNFLEEDFTLRTKQSHERHCTEISHAPTDQLRNDLKVTYGINYRSSLCDLGGFDITTQLPQDIMHTLLEGSVQYELRHILSHYLTAKKFTLSQLNSTIASQKYGYSEIADKPGSLKPSVFSGEERYKLKYKAAQARLFLRLLPFILCNLVSAGDPVYKLVTELLAIVQILFSPVISLETINLLKLLIQEHLHHFKEIFLQVNITPKQHYMIHLPNMVKSLGPLVRYSCFSFESAHNYFKELARKQNFKNLAKSLAERCQLKECSNFGDSCENGKSHPLFQSKRNYGVLSIANDTLKRKLREKMDKLGLLPGVKLNNVYSASWVICHGTKFTKHGVIICSVDESSLLPMFGSIKQIWVLSEFVYLEYEALETMCFDENFQAYKVQEISHVEDNDLLCAYSSLVDCNVFHIHEGSEGELYVPVKYDISDLMEHHVKGRNPLKF